MAAQTLRNISLREYRRFLEKAGCRCTRTRGGHEHWTRHDLNRPITIQTHIDPVPEFIIRNGLRILGISRQEFMGILSEMK